MKQFKLVLCGSILFLACNSNAKKTEQSKAASSKENTATAQSFTDRFYHPDKNTLAKVEALYQAMSPKERASQMIMTASSTYDKLGYPFAEAKNMVQNDVAANVVFLKGTAAAFKQESATLNQLHKDKNNLKPLLACDCEPTLLPSKWSDVNDIIPASQQQDVETVKENTEKINAVVSKTGVQLNFAPIVDIAANKSVINKRSFGTDNKTVVTLASQFVQTTQEAGIGATLKHFPGHGAVKGDSHKQSVYIDGPLTELQNFKDIIQSETPPISVMVGHIIVKNNEHYNTNNLPATLSHTIVTDLLRKELHFNGIITTDALNMEAAAKVPDADWKSVQAGVDLVLMPKNASLLNQKIVTALSQNDEMKKQLETSIKRIILFKVITQQ